MRSHGYLSPVLYLPFFDVNLALPWPVYMVFAAFVMVGTVNAVNITDGIDGLAAGSPSRCWPFSRCWPGTGSTWRSACSPAP